MSPTIDDADWGGSIDPDIFTDTTGDSFLIWKSDGNHLGRTVPTTSGPCRSRPTSLASRGRRCQLMSDDQPWQSGIVEGPDMVETQTPSGNSNPPTDNYYLFYSGSDEGASTYAIGWAGCPTGPSGPCTDMSTTSPLLGTSPGLSGPGGPDVYSRRWPAGDGLGRLAGLDDRLSDLRHPAHVSG